MGEALVQEKRQFKFSEAVVDPRDGHWKMPEDLTYTVGEQISAALPIIAHVAWRASLYVMLFLAVFVIDVALFAFLRS